MENKIKDKYQEEITTMLNLQELQKLKETDSTVFDNIYKIIQDKVGELHISSNYEEICNKLADELYHFLKDTIDKRNHYDAWLENEHNKYCYEHYVTENINLSKETDVDSKDLSELFESLKSELKDIEYSLRELFEESEGLYYGNKKNLNKILNFDSKSNYEYWDCCIDFEIGEDWKHSIFVKDPAPRELKTLATLYDEYINDLYFVRQKCDYSFNNISGKYFRGGWNDLLLQPYEITNMLGNSINEEKILEVISEMKENIEKLRKISFTYISKYDENVKNILIEYYKENLAFSEDGPSEKFFDDFYETAFIEWDGEVPWKDELIGEYLGVLDRKLDLLFDFINCKKSFNEKKEALLNIADSYYKNYFENMYRETINQISCRDRLDLEIDCCLKLLNIIYYNAYSYNKSTFNIFYSNILSLGNNYVANLKKFIEQMQFNSEDMQQLIGYLSTINRINNDIIGKFESKNNITKAAIEENIKNLEKIIKSENDKTKVRVKDIGVEPTGTVRKLCN